MTASEIVTPSVEEPAIKAAKLVPPAVSNSADVMEMSVMLLAVNFANEVSTAVSLVVMSPSVSDTELFPTLLSARLVLLASTAASFANVIAVTLPVSAPTIVPKSVTSCEALVTDPVITMETALGTVTSDDPNTAAWSTRLPVIVVACGASTVPST